MSGCEYWMGMRWRMRKKNRVKGSESHDQRATQNEKGWLVQNGCRTTDDNVGTCMSVKASERRRQTDRMQVRENRWMIEEVAPEMLRGSADWQLCFWWTSATAVCCLTCLWLKLGHCTKAFSPQLVTYWHFVMLPGIQTWKVPSVKLLPMRSRPFALFGRCSKPSLQCLFSQETRGLWSKTHMVH